MTADDRVWPDPLYPPSGTMTAVKKAATMAAKGVMKAEFAQSYMAQPKTVRELFLVMLLGRIEASRGIGQVWRHQA
jgi:DNA-binding phage protein